MSVNSNPKASKKYEKLSCLKIASVVYTVINLYFPISPRIFIKTRNGPNWFMKNPEVENLVSYSF
jgi:hypothetical protein